jgi:uncharacterized protein (TIGR02118 family)
MYRRASTEGTSIVSAIQFITLDGTASDPDAVTARFIAVYETPADPETFDRHYREVHIPLARKLAGLRRYTVSRDVTAVRGAPYYLVAELEWDTMNQLHAAFNSPAGRAVADDAALLQQLATVRSMIFAVDETVM